MGALLVSHCRYVCDTIAISELVNVEMLMNTLYILNEETLRQH